MAKQSVANIHVLQRNAARASKQLRSIADMLGKTMKVAEGGWDIDLANIEREGQVKIDKVVNALKAGQVDEAL